MNVRYFNSLKMNRPGIYLVFLLFYIVSSCGQDYQKEFNLALSTAVRNDDVKPRQWDNLIDKMNDAVRHGAKLTQNVTNKEELILFIWENYPNINGSVSDLVRKITRIDQINIYLENSSSMGGYFPQGGNMKFSAPIIDLFNLGGETTEIKTFLVGEKFLPIETRKFRSDLSDGKIANGKESPLADIFSSIIDDCKENEVSFLITDGIMSGSNADIAKNKEYNYVHKADLRQQIREVFQQAKKKNLSIVIFRFESPFKGKYYDYTNGIKNLDVSVRPYYIFAFGDMNALNIIMNNAKKELDFKPANTMIVGQKNQTIAQYRFKTGRAPEYIPNQNTGVLTFKKVTKDADFSIKVNLIDVPDFVKDVNFMKKNIRLTTIDHSSKQTIAVNDYIEGIEITNSATNEYQFNFYLPKDFLLSKPNTLNLLLKIEPDSWYKQFASDRDDGENFENDKTFAFDYLIEGILLGLDQMDDADIINITLNIK